METGKSVARLRLVRELLGRTASEDEGEEKEAGFTLIELMVVLLIMGILLAIAIPTFLSVTGSADKTAAQSNLTNSITSATAIYTNTQSFPPINTPTNKTNPGILYRLGKTQNTITYQKGNVANGTKGKNVVSVARAATTDQVIVVASLDAKTVCWFAALNESGSVSAATSVEAGIPVGNSFYGVKNANTCGAATAVAATKWKPSFSTIKGLT